MNVHWEHKKKRSSNMSNTRIDEWHGVARKNGAVGGKLIGAGGGGFLMFYADSKAACARRCAKPGCRRSVSASTSKDHRRDAVVGGVVPDPDVGDSLLPVAILAGGFATRLRPITQKSRKH
jgi:D-glycero-alpha-D-manno-heptose-7-phosphate kinase